MFYNQQLYERMHKWLEQTKEWNKENKNNNNTTVVPEGVILKYL
jgi:hypothetical protein